VDRRVVALVLEVVIGLTAVGLGEREDYATWNDRPRADGQAALSPAW
jgi:hypothetical protein